MEEITCLTAGRFHFNFKSWNFWSVSAIAFASFVPLIIFSTAVAASFIL